MSRISTPVMSPNGSRSRMHRNGRRYTPSESASRSNRQPETNPTLGTKLVMDDPYGRSLNHKFTGNAVQIESPYHDTNPCLAFGTNKPSGRTERDKADSRAFHALDAAPRLGAL